MAHIIAFRPGSSTRSAAPEPVRATAEIVIFPGVRYERTGSGGHEAPNAANGTRRDRLSIPD